MIITSSISLFLPHIPVLTLEELQIMAENRFTLGRPKYHVVAQRGWMNDPCAPGYDPATDTFHLMYQWNAHSHVWNNISWGGVISTDLVHWKYSSDKVQEIFKPDEPYDINGIFTGCMVPTAVDGSSPGLSIFYTSVPRIPIHWSWPHDRGQEGVALATSSDGGKTWVKSSSNPIVEAEPDHLFVTGFRDPAVIPWPQMDKARSLEPGSATYALIAGGVQGEDEGPRLFLYEVDPKDLAKWTFLQTLGNWIPRIYIPDPKWSGDYGTNWECPTIFTLRDSATGTERSIGLLGVEGAKPRHHVAEYRAANPGRHERAPRFYNWFMIDLEEDKSGGMDMRFKTTGLVDWAELYALSCFPHPDGRRIGWGWLVELDLDDEAAKEKGSIGCLGLPREFDLKVYDGVVGTSKTPVEEITSFEVTTLEDGRKRAVTVGTQPLRELETLRTRSIFSQGEGPAKSGRLLEAAPECCEIRIVAQIDPSCSSFGVRIREAQDGSIGSLIEFVPAEETLAIRRSTSTNETKINTQDEIAPFTLLQFTTPNQPKLEELELRVFIDKDTVEVFANGRITMATRLYSPAAAAGISLHVEGKATVLSTEIWEMGSIGLVA